jgi:hypothetical protein
MSKQILITDAVKLRKIIEFACNNECERDLGHALIRLLLTCTNGMVNNREGAAPFEESAGDTLAVISDDFAAHSLRFFVMDDATARTVSRDSKCRWNGGFIYEGPGQPLDGSFPALTVSLSSNPNKHSWGIHT